jgi:SAM-dependent methyltransferase
LLGQNELSHDDVSRVETVADLGCGAGNLALPLAWWLNCPSQRKSNVSYRVLGIDLNNFSLQRLRDRARLLTPNTSHMLVETLEMDLLCLVTGEYTDAITQENIQFSDCSAVVSLHACGAASDLAIEAAVRHNLPFAISPCCIGKGLNVRSGIVERNSVDKSITTKLPLALPTQRGSAPNGTISYPRSQWLHDKVTPENYRLLASAADYGVGLTTTAAYDIEEVTRWQRSRRAKQIVEIDRLQWAYERGYYVRILELPRIGPLYSKRELLLGALRDSPAALRIAELPVYELMRPL